MTEFKPQIALVLGSGLGDYAEKIKIETVIDYHEIKGFPVSTVQGHKGRFVLGYVEDIPVMIMEGRVHYYEGYSMSDVVLPIRLMKMMGAEILFLTNASGGIHRGFEAGDFMMITDQIASFVPSPLIGPNIEEFGERFPDMSHIYDEELQEVIRKVQIICRSTSKKEPTSSLQVLILNPRQKSGCVKPSVQMQLE